MKNTKRILGITVATVADPDADTSTLGEYLNHRVSRFTIDRWHTDDCPAFSDGDADCNCIGERTPACERFFEPATVEAFDPNAEWLAKVPAPEREAFWRDTMRSSAKWDYERIETYAADQWSYIGLYVIARVQLAKGSPEQVIRSGGLWGIESDAGDYLNEVAQEELAQLRAELHAAGFSKRAITSAVKAADLTVS